MFVEEVIHFKLFSFCNNDLFCFCALKMSISRRIGKSYEYKLMSVTLKDFSIYPFLKTYISKDTFDNYI